MKKILISAIFSINISNNNTAHLKFISVHLFLTDNEIEITIITLRNVDVKKNLSSFI